MGLEDFQSSARYRQRVIRDLTILFPHLTDPDESSLGKIDLAMLEKAYQDRLGEIAAKFAPKSEEADLFHSRLTAGFQHLATFLHERETILRRGGPDPLQMAGDITTNEYKSVFLSNNRRTHLIAVGGGKGGIGKSMLASNLAIALASMGRDVVAMDMDLGGADLHLQFGLRNISRSLNDFIDRKYESLDEVRMNTAYKNLSVIATDSSRLGVANIKYSHKEKIIRHLGKLNCDVVIVDLGANVSFDVLDIFSAADQRLVVTSTEPTSILEAYSLIKLSLYRRIRHFANEFVPRHSELGQTIAAYLFETGKSDNGGPKNVWQLAEAIGQKDLNLKNQLLKRIYRYRIDLVINMSESDNDRNIGAVIARLCQQNLIVSIQNSYLVPWDKHVRAAARRLLPVLAGDPHSAVGRSLLAVAADVGAGRATPADLSQRVNHLTRGIQERVDKLREISMLNAPDQPVNRLIAVSEQKPKPATRLRAFLNKDIHLGK